MPAETNTPAVAAASPSTELLRELESLVARNTRQWKRLIVLELLAVLVAAPLGYLWVVFSLDILVHLPGWGRVATSAIFLLVVAGLLRWIWRRWREVRLTEDQVALAIERQTPGTSNQLINSLQIARDANGAGGGGEHGLALLRENHASLQRIQLRQAANIRPAAIRLGIAGLAIAVGVGFYFFKREQFTNSAARLFQPFARIAPLYRTTLAVEPGDVRATPGSAVTVRVRIAGVRPARLAVAQFVGETRNVETVPVPAGVQAVEFTFRNLQRSLTYTVTGGDFTTPVYNIEVPLPPQVNLVRATLHLPEYTGVAPQKIETSGGELEALQGTRAEVTFVLDQPADAATLLLDGAVEKGALSSENTGVSPRIASGINVESKSGALAKGLTNSVTSSPSPPAGGGEGRGEEGRSGKSLPSPQPSPRSSLAERGSAAAGAMPPPAAARASVGASANASPRALELRRLSATEFSGEILFKNVLGYQVRAQRGKQTPGQSLKYGLRVLSDQPPQPTLAGLDKRTEAQLGAELRLKLAATDDFGLVETGLFLRRLTVAAPVGTNAPSADDGWQAVATWPQPARAREWKLEHALTVASLGVVEGERVELALRARDADPAKGKNWTSSEIFTVVVGGEGTVFQVLYEQILQSETDLKKLITLQQEGVRGVAQWLQKLDPASGLRWDDRKNLDALATAVREQARKQDELRRTAGVVTREFVSAVGNLRFSLGMLADTEMVRAIRVLEGVATADDPQTRRAGLTEARLTQERTIRSLNEQLEQYIQFRQNWELANMTPFVKMLADRQAALRDESAANAPGATNAVANAAAGATKPAASAVAGPLVAKSAEKRQARVLALAGLAQVAIAGVGERVTPVDQLLGQAFSAAAVAFDSSGAKSAMQQGATQAAAGQWAAAAAAQTRAAAALAEIHTRLKQAGAEAIARAMKEMERKESLLAAQKALEKMLPGSGDKNVTFRQDLASLTDVVEMRETRAGKKAPGDKDKDAGSQPAIPPDLGSKLRTVESDVRPDLSTMFLGTRMEKTAKIPGLEGLQPNDIVAPLVPDKLEDLVGKLLEEADEMNDKFDTLTLNSGQVSADPGEVSKMGGRLNSSAATATTGNKKPPTANVGGMSGTGRQGARSYGKVAGSESPNMRGRDQVQEGQFEAPEQAGVLKEKKTDDMQKDTSTGIGGKRVESDDTKFSLANKGEWQDKFADKMQKPQAVNHIVERQGKPLDPKVAALLRDMDGDGKQLIDRANALRKELKNLYLPTDHLDDLIAKLNQNLERLRENPTAESFRTQRELLDRLRAEARVFHRAQAGFQPSLPRNQQVRGRILDEPASPSLPAYERVVKDYFRRLAVP